MKRLLLAFGLVLLASQGYGQSLLPQSPVQIPTLNLSGAIAVTSTFQSIQVANTARRGCTIQNTGTNSMYVFFGPITDATIAKSVLLTSGASVQCDIGFAILTDQISITGTATETFYAGVQ